MASRSPGGRPRGAGPRCCSAATPGWPTWPPRSARRRCCCSARWRRRPGGRPSTTTGTACSGTATAPATRTVRRPTRTCCSSPSTRCSTRRATCSPRARSDTFSAGERWRRARRPPGRSRTCRSLHVWRRSAGPVGVGVVRCRTREVLVAADLSAPAGAVVPDVRRLAVLRANSIGDLLVVLPALTALRRAYPQAELTVIGSPWLPGLLDGRPGPWDRAVVAPRYPGLLGTSPDAGVDDAVRRAVAGLRDERYDLVLQLHGGGRTSNAFVRALH